MLNNSKLGMVFPETYHGVAEFIKEDCWRKNWEQCKKICIKLGITLERNKNVEFPSGSMFWFKPEALKSLFNLGLTHKDFTPWYASDGTSHTQSKGCL